MSYEHGCIVIPQIVNKDINNPVKNLFIVIDVSHSPEFFEKLCGAVKCWTRVVTVAQEEFESMQQHLSSSEIFGARLIQGRLKQVFISNEEISRSARFFYACPSELQDNEFFTHVCETEAKTFSPKKICDLIPEKISTYSFECLEFGIFKDETYMGIIREPSFVDNLKINKMEDFYVFSLKELQKFSNDCRFISECKRHACTPREIDDFQP